MGIIFQEHLLQLAGTTTEWLFMAQGKMMLMIRGLKGGQGYAHPSSFSLSAAAYGGTSEVLYLMESSLVNSTCVWRGVSFFS